MSGPKEVKKVRSTVQQVNFLISYMAEHSEFAAGRFVGPQGAQKNKELWQKLAENLAELGPVKSAEQWKTTWRDLKCKSRAKNADARRAALSTGNTARIPVIGDITQIVINIIGRASSEGSGLPESSIGDGPEEVVLEIEYSNEHESSPDLGTSNTPTQPTLPPNTATGLGPRNKRRRLAATPDSGVGSRMVKAQEINNESCKELVEVVKHFSGVFESAATHFKDSMDRIGDIFERYTATQEERVRLLRHKILGPTNQPMPSTSKTSPKYVLQLESDSEDED